MTRSARKPARTLWVVSSLSAGGAERVISELANAWARRGLPTGVLTLSAPDSDHYPLLPTVERIALDVIWDSHTPWQSISGNIRRSRMIRKAVRNFRPDVVVSFIEQTNVRILASLSGTGIPVVVSERVDPRHHAIGRVWELARRLLYPFARRVVVQTDSIARGWARSIVRQGHLAVIPNFVRDLPEVPPFDGREPNLILAVGRLDRQKGFDLLLQAFAHSSLANLSVRLVILGEGPERHSLESIARLLGIEQAVSLPGVVQAPESWMERCTLFVMSSRYEGFPNALLEAMAMGCSVIAADCESGPREMIHQAKNGMLVPVGDVEALADMMTRLFEDATLRKRIGEKAPEVRKRFARETVLLQWEQLIMEAIQGE